MTNDRRSSKSVRRCLSVAVICRRLKKEYGPVQRQRVLAPLDELIATILSQNTSDRNSHAAFDALRRRFRDWDDARRARVETIAKTIRKGGLAKQKAPRIKAILEKVHRRHGRLSLDFLCSMPTEEAIDYLRSFPGVGPKTVACVLLFACGKPVLPVDTHVHRLSRRLGLISQRISAKKAHDELAKLVTDHRVLEFHIQLIRHGRRVCSARNPHCRDCVLRDGCPEGGLTSANHSVSPSRPVA